MKFQRFAKFKNFGERILATPSNFLRDLANFSILRILAEKFQRVYLLFLANQLKLHSAKISCSTVLPQRSFIYNTVLIPKIYACLGEYTSGGGAKKEARGQNVDPPLISEKYHFTCKNTQKL
eukprot:TRINITY_DN11358_c0_g1_i1.p7 TRINITY_DN11358_c0_g1~~TRINITY_DN11358_c0_g1_i1.p7  ORF type:complete len:122 (+),score=5.42 TRINITY_DN11358_c0_g1_i1:596-961(+)